MPRPIRVAQDNTGCAPCTSSSAAKAVAQARALPALGNNSRSPVLRIPGPSVHGSQCPRKLIPCDHPSKTEYSRQPLVQRIRKKSPSRPRRSTHDHVLVRVTSAPPALRILHRQSRNRTWFSRKNGGNSRRCQRERQNGNEVKPGFFASIRSRSARPAELCTSILRAPVAILTGPEIGILSSKRPRRTCFMCRPVHGQRQHDRIFRLI